MGDNDWTDQRPFGTAVRQKYLGSDSPLISTQSRMTKKKKPGWGRAFLYLATGSFFAFHSITGMYPNWTPPSQDALIAVKGTFVGRHSFGGQAYLFQTEAGETMQLGCVPEIRNIDCLEGVGTSEKALAGVPVTIGYFRVHTPWWEVRRASWPNILVTLQASEKIILPYSKSKARLDRAYAFEQKTKWMLPVVLLPFAAAWFCLALIIVIKKIKREL